MFILVRIWALHVVVVGLGHGDNKNSDDRDDQRIHGINDSGQL